MSALSPQNKKKLVRSDQTTVAAREPGFRKGLNIDVNKYNTYV